MYLCMCLYNVHLAQAKFSLKGNSKLAGGVRLAAPVVRALWRRMRPIRNFELSIGIFPLYVYMLL